MPCHGTDVMLRVVDLMPFAARAPILKRAASSWRRAICTHTGPPLSNAHTRVTFVVPPRRRAAPRAAAPRMSVSARRCTSCAASCATTRRRPWISTSAAVRSCSRRARSRCSRTGARCATTRAATAAPSPSTARCGARGAMPLAAAVLDIVVSRSNARRAPCSHRHPPVVISPPAVLSACAGEPRAHERLVRHRQRRAQPRRRRLPALGQ